MIRIPKLIYVGKRKKYCQPLPTKLAFINELRTAWYAAQIHNNVVNGLPGRLRSFASIKPSINFLKPGHGALAREKSNLIYSAVLV